MIFYIVQVSRTDDAPQHSKGAHFLCFLHSSCAQMLDKCPFFALFRKKNAKKLVCFIKRTYICTEF